MSQRDVWLIIDMEDAQFSTAPNQKFDTAHKNLVLGQIKNMCVSGNGSEIFR